MKRIGFILLTALLLAGTACQRETPSQDSTRKQMLFTASFQDDTKATSTAFEKGDRIGLFIGSPVNKEDILLTASGSTLVSESPLYWPADIKQSTRVAFQAYYPYHFQSGFSPLADATVTLPADQSSGYAGYDVLYACTTATPADASVHLAFTHAFSRLRIQVADNLASESFKSLTVGSLKATATVNLAAGSVSPKNGSEQEFTPFASDKNTLYLLVLPQNASPVIHVTLASGKQMTYKTDQPITFKACKTVSATISLYEDQIQLTYEIIDWDEDGSFQFYPEESGGDTPLQIQVDCPKELNYGPSIAFEESVGSLITVTANKDLDKIRVQGRTTESWIYLMDNGLAVNGNPSVNARTGIYYVDVYYGAELYTTKSIQINQAGVYTSITSTSNWSDFDLFSGQQMSAYSVLFTPYGGTESVTFASNSDGCCDPLSQDAAPQLFTGDSFVEGQTYPDVQVGSGTFTITYGSNRSLLFKGCLLRYVPIIYVVGDWSDLEHSLSARFVQDQEGNVAYLNINVFQSPVCVEAEYGAYYALPVSGSNDPYPGYNVFKGYKGGTTVEPMTDEIVITSNVSWTQCEASLPEDGLSYHISNPIQVKGDGKHLVTTRTSMKAPDRLTLYDDEYTWPFTSCYRPEKDYQSLQTALRAWVDLKDGLSPLPVTVAPLIQVGVPHVVFGDYQIENLPRGSYDFEGETYPYCDKIHLNLSLQADPLTLYFVKNDVLFFNYDASKDSYFNLGLSESKEYSFVVSHYCSPDSPDDPFVVRRIIMDYLATMTNDVVIRAEWPVDEHWTEDPRYAPAQPVPAASSLDLTHDSRFKDNENQVLGRVDHHPSRHLDLSWNRPVFPPVSHN